MKTFFEEYRSGKLGFMVNTVADEYFPSHFHQNIEIFVCLSGSQEIMVDGEKFTATGGDIIVIDGYKVHSYGESKSGNQRVIIIPHDYLSEFNKLREGKIFAKKIISNKNLAQKIVSVIDETLFNNPTDYQIFASVNMIISLILKESPLIIGESASEQELINKILLYVENNFKENISLKSVAKSLGYAEGHLSRVFHRYVKTSFPRYVNQRRLDFVEQNILKKNQPLSNLIYEAGFNSFQTYYRSKNLQNK